MHLVLTQDLWAYLEQELILVHKSRIRFIFLCTFPCRWGRWNDILTHGRYKRQLTEQDVETICRTILVYCLNHYKGDENIKSFIWDLITPTADGQTRALVNHSGMFCILMFHLTVAVIVQLAFCTHWFYDPSMDAIIDGQVAIKNVVFPTFCVLCRVS